MTSAANSKPRPNCSASCWGKIPWWLWPIAWLGIGSLLIVTFAANASPVSAPAELSTAVLPSPLHSRPGAGAIAYIDFTTYPSTASEAQIIGIWRVVSAAYSPFNVDVTTEWPGARGNVAWAVLGGPLQGTSAGQSAIGNWSTFGTMYGPVFASQVFADGLNNDPRLVGDATIHELGHAFGLLHQDDGWMNPTLLAGGQFWGVGPNTLGVPQDSFAIIAGQTGVAPVAEPGMLLTIGLAYLFSRRHHRHQNGRPADSATSQISTTLTSMRRVSLRTAWSRSVALTYTVWAYCCSAISCSKIASTLYRGMGIAYRKRINTPTTRRHERQSQLRPAASGTSRMERTSTTLENRTASSRLSASRYSLAGDSCPQSSTRTPSTRNLGMGVMYQP